MGKFLNGCRMTDKSFQNIYPFMIKNDALFFVHVIGLKEIAILKFIPHSLFILYHCKVVIVSHTSSALLIGKSL